MRTFFQSVCVVCWLFGSVQAEEPIEGGISIEADVPQYDNRWALVVGINYEDCKSVPKLDNAENDAKSVGELLKKNYDFKCEVLLGKEATRQQILSILAKLHDDKVMQKDCFLFYFAGHGMTKGEIPYLYPADVESEDGKLSNDLQASDVVNSIYDRPLHSLFIFDSCYSGQILQLADYPPLKRAVAVQGVPIFSSRSIQILTSSTNNQTAKDGKGGHSPFANKFLKYLVDRPAATAAEPLAVTKLAKSIEGNPQNGQLPQFLHRNPDPNAVTIGDFHFFRNSAVPIVKSLYFQTLPGSNASLPGSSVGKSWFDEMPWMTPEMRLNLDREIDNNPNAISVDGYPPKPEVEKIYKKVTTPDQQGAASGVSTVVGELLELPVDPKKKAEQIVTLLDGMGKSRNVHPTPTEPHLKALLQIATQSFADKQTAKRQQKEIDGLFSLALASYNADHYKGLRARCLADNANWLFESRRYKDARGKFDEAFDLVKDDKGLSLFKIELRAGAALAARQLAKDDAVVENKESLWTDARKNLDEAMSIANDVNPVKAYLHERLAWLAMDLWQLDEAVKHFDEAIAIRNETMKAPAGVDNLSAFLCRVHAEQGRAMASSRLTGNSAKQALGQIQKDIGEQIATNDKDNKGTNAERPMLFSRWFNVTERLADCDFLSGRAGMKSALSSYTEGLDSISEYRECAYTLSQLRAVDQQDTKLLCKAVIAAALVGDEDYFRKYEKQLLGNQGKGKEDSSTTMSILCALAEGFVKYHHDMGEDLSESNGRQAAQGSLDALRQIVLDRAAPRLDRESAELLTMIAKVVADEQRSLDARVLAEILPKTENGKVPQGAIRYVRDHYDQVILMQAAFLANKDLSDLPLRDFAKLALEAQGSTWSSRELGSPFAIFYFPVSGANGCMILRVDGEHGEVHQLPFGWKEVNEGLSQAMIDKVKQQMTNLPPKGHKTFWPEDSLVPLRKDCPLLSLSNGSQ